MIKRRHPNKVWYVEAYGHTNEKFAEDLPAENAHKGVLCIDGKKRDLWECDYSFIPPRLKVQASAQLDFTVYYREGQYGPVRKWPFAKKKKLTLAHSIKKGLVRKGLAPKSNPVK
jgi:hypothetical protein